MINQLLNIEEKINSLINQEGNGKIEFANNVEEEFFWIYTQKSKSKSELLTQFCKLNYSYFKELIEVRYCSEEQSPSKFMAMRFLMILAEECYNEGRYNEELIEIVKLLASNSDKIEWERHGIDFLVSQIISYLPLSILTEAHIRLLERLTILPNGISSYSLTERLIPRAINSKQHELLERLICGFVLKFRFNDVGSIIPFIDPYKTLSFLEGESFVPLVELIGIEQLFDWLNKPISAINAELPYEFSSVSFPSIEDTDQLWDKHSFKYVLLKLIRDSFELAKPNAELVVDELWNSDIEIYKRLAIHTINAHYKDMSEILWNELKNPFNHYYLKHELFVLIQKRSSGFSESQVLQIIDWLDQIDVQKTNEDETDNDLKRYKAVVIKEYLVAFTNLNSDNANIIEKRIAELDKINPANREHPGYNSYSETKWGNDYPDTQREFDSQTATTGSLATYFDTNNEKWTKYEIEGQLERLKFKVIQQPEFIEDVSPLLALDINAKSNLLSGITKAIENQKKPDLATAYKIIEVELPKISKTEVDLAQEIFLGNTCWLIREIGKNDSLQVSDENLKRAKEIILYILKLKTPLNQRNQDIIFDIINSVRGKAFEAMLSLMIRNGKAKPESSDKWFSDVKEYYTTILNEGKQDECFLYSVAGHLPHFSYLDFKWLEENIDSIFQKSNVKNWTEAMFFYTRLNSRVYGNLFKLFMAHNQHEFGIDIFTDKQKGINDFVKHVMISHLSKYEGQELYGGNSLIEKVLLKKDKEQIKAIINFLYTNDGYDIELIIPIWERILNLQFDEQDKQEVLKNLPVLLSKLKRFDAATTSLIESTITQIKGEFDRHRSFAHVLEFNKDLSDILHREKVIRLLFNQFTDDFYKEELKEFTRAIYKRDVSVANEFVDDMLIKRAFYLLDVYNEFNGIN